MRPPSLPGWTIDSTVEEIHRASVRLVREEDRWAEYRRFLEDRKHLEAHRDLRRRFFPAVRPLSVYRSALEEAKLRILDVQRDVITAQVSEWRDFLAAYHPGVLGWVGGAEKVTGSEPSGQTVDDRLELMSEAIREVFEGVDAFEACWTYITAEPA